MISMFLSFLLGGEKCVFVCTPYTAGLRPSLKYVRYIESNSLPHRTMMCYQEGLNSESSSYTLHVPLHRFPISIETTS